MAVRRVAILVDSAMAVCVAAAVRGAVARGAGLALARFAQAVADSVVVVVPAVAAAFLTPYDAENDNKSNYKQDEKAMFLSKTADCFKNEWFLKWNDHTQDTPSKHFRALFSEYLNC